MPELDTSPFFLVILSGFLMCIVTMGAALAYFIFARRAAALPTIDQVDRRKNLYQEYQERIAEQKTQMKENEKNLLDRELAAAEAQNYRDRADEAKAEWAALEDMRSQIKDVEEQTRAALEEFGEKRRELLEITGELETTRKELASFDSRKAMLTGSLEQLQAQEAEARQRCSAAQQEASKAEQARSELSRLKDELSEKHIAHTAMDQQIGQIEAIVADKKGDLERLNQKVNQATETWEAANQELEQVRREAATIKSEVKAKQSELHTVQDGVLKAQTKCEVLNLRGHELAEKVADLKDQVKTQQTASAELESRVSTAGADNSDETVNESFVLSDLLTVPKCLLLPYYLREPATINEDEALKQVRSYLTQCGLEFDSRTLNAFHTSLKINDISPMTILAGVSGTGKSQLPRRYAEAMGINFLQVPVQPRWDSPQDLIGFYNYIEKQYRATELAQALVHMDPHNWQAQSKGYEDRILLVLLDEMNLARVEYYFSEFLSRLEARPAQEAAVDENARSSAEIIIDLSTAGQNDARRLYPGHNILFVGTMNEDESTLSLSDKVLDRANLMRFAKPGELKTKKNNKQPPLTDQYLSKTTWQKWHRTLDDSRFSARQDTAMKAITELNEHLSVVDRPFGHRLAQAMLSYVANYPRDQHGEVRVAEAMADQIEFRVLPKLRGLDLLESRAEGAIKRISDLARNELNDSKLASDIDNAVDLATNSGGLFTWKGRSNKR